MGTILILLIVISFCSIFYFWLKKHNKKMIIASIVATFVFGSLYSLTPEYKQEAAKEEREAKVESHKKEVEKKKKEEAKVESHKDERAEKKEISKPKSQNKIVKKSSKKPKQKKNITSKNDLLVRAKKLKYGMSLTEVKRIMKVKPTEEENDDGFISLTYGKDVVDLQFDEHKRLTAALAVSLFLRLIPPLPDTTEGADSRHRASAADNRPASAHPPDSWLPH